MRKQSGITCNKTDTSLYFKISHQQPGYVDKTGIQLYTYKITPQGAPASKEVL